MGYYDSIREMVERMKENTLAQAMINVEREHQAKHAPDTIEQRKDPAFAAGARAGMECIVSPMFSEEGIQRAADAYEARADLNPLNRMQWAMAAAIEATEYITE